VPSSSTAPTDPSSPGHWDAAYRRDDLSTVSWYQREPVVSLELVDDLGVDSGAAVVDVGGGASPLAGCLLDRGFADVTVLDLAGTALDAARGSLGPRGSEIAWVQGDVRSWRPDRLFGLWHDRALLHFFVAADDRRRYVETLRHALAPGGAAVIATFGPDGPDTCSGLPVVRYDAAGIASVLGDGFELVAERREEHATPAGRVQPFTWAAFRRVAR
jgi:SAM-dependent methyltransferase